MERLKELAAFINERWAIHEKRRSGMPPPWTKDLILRTYRFCNVHREHDRVTKWIFDKWLLPHRTERSVWFASVVARFVNWPETLEELSYPNNWGPIRARWFVDTLEARQSLGRKTFTSAYMIRAVEASEVGGGKARYLAEMVLTPMWERRETIEAARGSLRQFHDVLQCQYGMGSFLAGQVVADVKHTHLLSTALDWHTFAAMGPGSERGMSWVEFGDANTSYSSESWRASMIDLRRSLLPRLSKELRYLDAQNVQNCLCEFDKYMRAKTGQGRPKQKFKMSEEEYR